MPLDPLDDIYTPNDVYEKWRKSKLKPLHIRFIDAVKMFFITLKGDLDYDE